MRDIVLKTIDGTQNTYQNVDKIAIPTPDGNTAIFTEGQAVSKTVEPNFASGDMTVPISDGELVTKLTVKKPEALISDNIKKDINIGGVTGTLSGAGMQDIDTEAAMDALLVAANIGNAYRFTGDTTSKYIKGDIYVVEDGK